MHRLEGYIESVLVATDPKTFLSSRCASIKVGLEGFEGDNHAGMTMLSGSRTPYYPRGTVIRNSRQVSLVSVEEMAVVAAGMQLPEVLPEWLGANLLLSGLPMLTQLPPSTRLFFPQDTVIVIDGENFPCSYPARLIQELHPQIPQLAAAFLKSAMHRRGLVGWVERPGLIEQGDTVRAEFATQVIYSYPK
jgi:hypothetical protein